LCVRRCGTCESKNGKTARYCCELHIVLSSIIGGTGVVAPVPGISVSPFARKRRNQIALIMLMSLL
jgi:hypothetical protein